MAAGDVSEHDVRPPVGGGHTEGRDNSRASLQGVERIPPFRRRTHRIDRAETIQVYREEKVTPPMRAIRKSLEEDEPRSGDDKHTVPIRAHREDVKPVTEQVDGGHVITLLTECLKRDYAIHGSRRKLRKWQSAVADDRLSKRGERQRQASIGIENVDGDITEGRMRGDKFPDHLVLRLIFVVVHRSQSIEAHYHGSPGKWVMLIQHRGEHIEKGVLDLDVRRCNKGLGLSHSGSGK